MLVEAGELNRLRRFGHRQSAVSTVSAVQKLFSAVMIFLFGLALRNMLKMK